MRRLVVGADDFGRTPAINEAVERAHRGGILTTTSLMVGAPAAADAVARARRLGDLKVGLHLVLADGAPVLPAATVPALIGPDGDFDRNMARAGVRWFFDPRARAQLAAEIGAQFEAFRATGLALDHVNGHKHVHLHPTVARLVVAIGRDYGMHAVRVPEEPAAVLHRAFPGERYRAPPWRPVIGALRRRLRRAGLAAPDHVFGIAWTGRMVADRLLALLPHLPEGTSEFYCHPAVAPFPEFPDYRPQEELAALLDPTVRERIAELDIRLVGYADLTAGE